MSYYLAAESSSISDISGYAIYASLCVGDGGSGIPNADVGNDSESFSANYGSWDSDFSNGFDSDTLEFSLTAPSGSGSLTAGSNSLSFSDTHGTIQSVELVAGVQISGKAIWSNVAVSFYRSGSLIETDDIGAGPSVDTTSSSIHTGQQVLVVTPTQSNCDKVVVSGKVRLSSPQGNYPGANDLFCNAFIFTN